MRRVRAVRSVPTPSLTRRKRSAQTSPDVAIVGAGIIGCALARELAHGGARVTLLERGRPGSEASAAAAGMLGPRAECEAPGPLLTLGVASLALYGDVARGLCDETGIDPEYEREGVLYVALDADDERLLGARADWQGRAGFPVERLDAHQVRSLEPGLAEDARAGFLFPEDHRVDNVRLTRAYAVAAARLGVELRTGISVRRVLHERGRALGVEAAGGSIAAGAVVNAAGAWSDELAPRPGHLPVKPVRGQMAMLLMARPPFRHAIYSRGVYLVPRRDGRLLAGSTYEDVGFDKRVTAEAMGGILARTLHLAPILGAATLADTWAGLRPGSADGLPILGGDPEIAGLYYATGHYRNGILLAPATARALAELVLGGRTSYDLAPFAIERFATRAARGRTASARKSGNAQGG